MDECDWNEAAALDLIAYLDFQNLQVSDQEFDVYCKHYITAAAQAVNEYMNH